MEFLCTSSDYLNGEQSAFLYNKKVKIIHKAKLGPIYFIEAHDRHFLEQLNFFDKIREPLLFSLANITFQPHIPHKLLVKNAKVGWGIKVAVLDSGVISQMVTTSYSKDYTGYGNNIVHIHGTQVAQIIKYYAPGSQIFSFKVAHNGNDINEGRLIMALDGALDKKVDIINMSLEFCRGCFGQCMLCNYVNSVVNNGVTVVTVAGNQGKTSGNTISCPGAAERAITVGQIAPDGKLDDSSGKGTPGFDKPNILAPGSVRIKNGNQIQTASGTSFSAPIISGVLAALFSKYSDRQAVITKLYDSCDSIGLPKHEQGFGVLNLPQLLEVLNNDSISNTGSGQKQN